MIVLCDLLLFAFFARISRDGFCFSYFFLDNPVWYGRID